MEAVPYIETHVQLFKEVVFILIKLWACFFYISVQKQIILDLLGIKN